MERPSKSNLRKHPHNARWCYTLALAFTIWFLPPHGGVAAQEENFSNQEERLPAEVRRLLSDYRGQDTERKVKAQARLAALGARAVTTMPILSSSLDAKDWRMRRFALRLLSRFGPPQDIIPMLQRATRDSNYRVRSTAMTALKPYGASSLSAYLAVLDQNDWWKLRWRAAKEIGALGEKTSLRALPVMKDALQKERDMRVRIGVVEALGEMGPHAAPLLRRTLLSDLQPKMRLAAAKALHRMGPRAASAVQELTRAAQDEDKTVRQAAALALSQIGPKATPGLLRLLKFGGTAQERKIAAQAIGNLGDKASDALPTLVESLRDPDKEVQQAVLIAMGKMGRDAVPHLRKVLQKSAWWRARWYAADGLGKIGPKAHRAIPALVRALQDRNRSVQENAAIALTKMLPYSTKILAEQADKHRWWRIRQIAAGGLTPTKKKAPLQVLRNLEKAISDESHEVRAAAARNLSKYGPAAVPYLRRSLKKSKDADVRRILILGLGEQKHKAGSAAKELGQALRDGDVEVQLAAVRALAQIGGPGAKILREALQEHPFWRVRYLSARALGLWKRGGRASQTALRKGLTDSDRRVREVTIGALGQLGRASLGNLRIALKNDWWFIRARAARYIAELKPKDAVELLTPLLEDDNEQARQAAAKMLGQLGTKALPALINALSQKRFLSLRWIAAVEIGRFRSEATPAISALTEALSADDARVRLAAAEALSYIGPAAQASAEALSKRIQDPDERVRLTSAEALGNLGEQAAETAIPALKKGLKDSNPKVQKICAQSLGKMGPKALKDLRRYLKDHPQAPIRALMAKSIGFLAPKDSVTLGALALALKDNSTDVRDAVIKAVRHIKTSSARKLLEKTLLENDWWKARQSAADALGELAYTATLSILKKGLDDTDPRVRIAVMYAISEYGARAESYIPMFEKIREDPDPAIQSAAERALRRIRFLIKANKKKK
ncbi:MAG: HEAT repeat domain-containing protein [Myxococcales bacterium]|nr:HEAT repeat domain-containing protein [Myxococcales bacterium]